MHKTNNLYQGYIWSRRSHHELERMLEENDVNIPESQIVNGHIGDIPPPTYFALNEFTAPFQEVVSTYGVPRYKEVNPAYFSIITFPFLFGVMFGDVGHGSFFLIVGLVLCQWKDQLEKIEVVNTFVRIRYMLAMMGFFSLFCGVIYNDFMSIPLQYSSTCYTKTISAYNEYEGKLKND